MKCYKISINENWKISQKLAACIGYFDGIHLGHKALIDKTVETAKAKGIESALITFDPDPWVTIKGVSNLPHLNTMEERMAIAEGYGIQNWIVLDFTKEMMSLPSRDFIQCISRCNLDTLVCGFDFHYGVRGSGNIETLKEEAEGLFDVIVIDSVNQNNEKISTTRITKLIEQGNVELANELLNYTYLIRGKVIHGRSKGKLIGFPTSNIQVSSEYVIPGPGVYATYLEVDEKQYMAMLNIGHNPTFNYTDQLSVEANILDFNADIYGKEVTLRFICYLRKEKKFDTVDELVAQLTYDQNRVRQVLSHE